MRRLAVLVSLLMVATIAAAAGCGGSDGSPADAAREDYAPIRSDLLALNEDLTAALDRAPRSSDDEIKTAFRGFADRARSARERLIALEVPDDLADERDALQKGIGTAAADLGQIAASSGAGDTTAVRIATLRLVEHSTAARAARTAFEAALGVGPSIDEATPDYLAARAELVEVGQDIGAALDDAGQRSDAEPAASLGQLQERTTASARRIGALEVPPDLADERDALAQAVGVAATDLGRIAAAAAAHDGQTARAATQELVSHSETVRTTRDALDAPFGVRDEDRAATTDGTATTAP